MKDRTGRKKSIFYLLFTVFCLLSITTPGMGLIVTEVMYHPVDGQEELEFIELYNNRAVFEDLSGYAFTNGIQYTFESGTILEAKDYLVVTRNPVAFAAAYPAIALSSIYGPFSGRLANDGERIELSDNAGQIIVSFRYDEESPWPVSPDGTGHSLVLSRNSGDPEEASTWATSTTLSGTPGEPDEIQTASTANPSLAVLVSLGHSGRYFKGYSEPSPDSAGRATTDWTEIDFQDNPIRTAWIEGPSGYGYSSEADELQYIGTQTNDMSGNYISIYARFPFTLSYSRIASFSQLHAEVHYDDDYILYLNGTRVAASDGLSGNPPAYNQSGGSATDPAPVLIDLTNRLNLLVHGTNVLAMQVHNASLSGSSDCFASPILRAIVGNVGGGDDSRARVLINELLANSDVNSGSDWIELYNPGPVSIDLSNVYLSDDRADL
ncbi:MAG: lamin tail domain-containing protein, partial [Sedimentisphaerales bacterium]|nr:lamin tail domain-containing protein [Sedimentisphaerales bacterium]